MYIFGDLWEILKVNRNIKGLYNSCLRQFTWTHDFSVRSNSSLNASAEHVRDNRSPGVCHG